MALAKSRVSKPRSIVCRQCDHVMLPGDLGVYFNDGAVVHIRCYAVGSSTDAGMLAPAPPVTPPQRSAPNVRRQRFKPRAA